MRILVAGATGAIGRPLMAQLVARGHEVFGLTRSQTRAQYLAEQGATSIIVDVLNAEDTQRAIARIQPEGIIDQLTALPKTYTRQSMGAAAELNDRTRQEGGANLLTAAQGAGTQRYAIQSCGFWYAPGEGLADEATPFAFEGSPAVASGTRLYAELETRVFQADSITGMALRYGFFYGPGTWYASDGDMANQVRRQIFPLVGEGQGAWSWIHIEDAAAATVAAIEQGQSGAYNIVDDDPAPMSRWLPAYAQWLDTNPPPAVTIAETLQIQGEDAVYYATQLRGASNQKAKRELGFQPRPGRW